MISDMCYVSLEGSQSFLTEGNLRLLISFLTEGNLSTAEDKDGTLAQRGTH